MKGVPLVEKSSENTIMFFLVSHILRSRLRRGILVSLLPVLRNIDLIPVAYQKVHAAVQRSSGVQRPAISSGATSANLKSEGSKACKSNRIPSKGRRNYIVRVLHPGLEPKTMILRAARPSSCNQRPWELSSGASVAIPKQEIVSGEAFAATDCALQSEGSEGYANWVVLQPRV